MLGLDTEKQQNWQRQTAREGAEEARQKALIHDLQSNTVTVAPDNGRDVSDLMAQIGRPLTAQQVIERLKKCNSRLVFLPARGYPLYGIYLLDPTGRVHVTPEGQVMTIRHICGMESGIMPEFSVLHKTKARVPDQELFSRAKPSREVAWKEVETFGSETRGWRTVLVRLLHAGLITRLQVEQYFGWQPSYDSQKWKTQTQ